MTSQRTPPDLDPYDGADALTIGADRVQRSMDRDASAGGLTTGRIQSLSDGVFSVAMTLMVLNLIVPAAGTVRTDQDLVGHLGHLGSAFAVYALSFMITGLFWVGQHAQFHYIQLSDRNLLWVNLVFLMTVVLLPFSTTLVANFPMLPLSAFLYGANLAGTGVLLTGIWRYATRHHLLFPGVSNHTVELVRERAGFGPRVVGVGMAVAAAGVVIDVLAGAGPGGIGTVLGYVALVVYATVPVAIGRPSHLDDHLKHSPDRSHE